MIWTSYTTSLPAFNLEHYLHLSKRLAHWLFLNHSLAFPFWSLNFLVSINHENQFLYNKSLYIYLCVCVFVCVCKSDIQWHSFIYLRFWPCCTAYGIFVPQLGIEPRPLPVNCWTAREFHIYVCPYLHGMGWGKGGREREVEEGGRREEQGKKVAYFFCFSRVPSLIQQKETLSIR